MSGVKRIALRLVARWETLLVVGILGVGVWSASLSPFFLRRANLLDLLTPYAFIGLMAFGLAFVVIAGEIDISLISNLAVSVVCFAKIFEAGVSRPKRLRSNDRTTSKARSKRTRRSACESMRCDCKLRRLPRGKRCGIIVG